MSALEKGKKADLPPLNAPQGLFVVQQEEFAHKAQYEKMKALLAGMDLNAITPIQALQLLMKIKEEL